MAANKKHSLGVRVPSKASYCMTYPIWFEKGSRELMTSELILISPVMVKFSDTSREERKLRRVVLPEPDGPKIAVKLSG